MVEQQPLPAASPFRYMRAGSRPLDRLGLGRQVVVQESDELRAKRLDPASKVSCTRTTYQVLNIYGAVRYD